MQFKNYWDEIMHYHLGVSYNHEIYGDEVSFEEKTRHCVIDPVEAFAELMAVMVSKNIHAFDVWVKPATDVPYVDYCPKCGTYYSQGGDETTCLGCGAEKLTPTLEEIV